MNGKTAPTVSCERSPVSTLRSVRCETLPSVPWISSTTVFRISSTLPVARICSTRIGCAR